MKELGDSIEKTNAALVIIRAAKQRCERQQKAAEEEAASMGPRMKRLNDQMVALNHEIALDNGSYLDGPEDVMHSTIDYLLHREDAYVRRHKAKARTAASKTAALVALVQRFVEPPSLIDRSLLPTPTLTPTPTPTPAPAPASAAVGSRGDARDRAKHGSGSPGSARTPRRPAGTSSPGSGGDSPRSRAAKTAPRPGRTHVAAAAVHTPESAPASGTVSPTCVADVTEGGDSAPHDGRLAARQRFDAEVEQRRKTAEQEAGRARVQTACTEARDLRKQLRTPIEQGGCTFKPSREFQGHYTRPEKALIVV